MRALFKVLASVWLVARATQSVGGALTRLWNDEPLRPRRFRRCQEVETERPWKE
jgi:hypothetical protein